MLYQLGPLQITVFPVSLIEASREAEADFAWKDVIGGLRPAEAVGLGNDEVSWRCALHPHRFGGLGELEAIYAMLAAQDEQILVRGDGSSLGWRVLTKVVERGTYLDVDGVGRCIEVAVTMKRTPPPSGAGGGLSLLTSLLGAL